MDASDDRDLWGAGIQPSVSKDKWVRFAVQKMARGYALIVSQDRRNATFFQAGKGYEMCAYKVARALIEKGLVVESGKHPLGVIYLVSPEAAEMA